MSFISWKTRLLILLALIIASLYQLAPTFLGLKDQKTALIAAKKDIPWYLSLLPEQELNLGLDLRGGLYMELSVDLEEAQRHQLNLLAIDLSRYVFKDKFPDSAPTVLDDGLIRITVKADARQAMIDALRDASYDDRVLTILPASNEAPNTLIIKPTDDYFTTLHNDTLEQASNAVRNRIDRYGVSEAGVSKLGSGRLAVEIPGVKNPEQVIDIIRRTGKLEFRLVDNSLDGDQIAGLIATKKTELGLSSEYDRDSVKKLNAALKEALPKDTSLAFEIERTRDNKAIKKATPYLVTNKVTVSGDMLSNAKVDSNNGSPIVSMSFNKIGAKNFGDLTKDNIGRSLAIVLDGVVMSAPRINSAITGGEAMIELGMGTYEALQREAKDLTLILREGALPASLTVESKNLIGPSLGQESIDAGLKSLLLAALIIVVFMMFYYRIGGVVANLALAINVLFIFAILCLFQASLSLPGIAGIVLTLGMAVDANVLIFERMREEKIMGKTVEAVVGAGYDNAMSAIIDGNLTTLISGLVLFEFGTGPIKGFASTLMIGIVTTMFTAIIVTRVFYDWMLTRQSLKKLILSV
jgi:protein-export membrane protein SecD